MPSYQPFMRVSAAQTLFMSLMSWWQARKTELSGKGSFTRARNKFSQTTLPLISPRRGRRILRREQLLMTPGAVPPPYIGRASCREIVYCRV